MRLSLPKNKFLVWRLLAVLVLLAALAFFLRGSILEVLNFKETSDQNGYVASGILYNTTLPKDEAEVLSKFLKSTLQYNYVPEELDLESVSREENREEFRASWLTPDSRLLTALYVSDTSKKGPHYLRVWSVDAELEIDAEKAKALAGQIFNQDFLGKMGEIKCRSVQAEDGSALTECGGVKRQAGGELFGITFHSPVSVEEADLRVTAVSACFVPSDRASSYPARTCI